MNPFLGIGIPQAGRGKTVVAVAASQFEEIMQALERAPDELRQRLVLIPSDIVPENHAITWTEGVGL